jgi:hypothetical protein
MQKWPVGAQLKLDPRHPLFMPFACHTRYLITACQYFYECGECNRTIYAIYFQKPQVGWGSAEKNAVEITIAL